jgi:hypothetical protein
MLECAVGLWDNVVFHYLTSSWAVGNSWHFLFNSLRTLVSRENIGEEHPSLKTLTPTLQTLIFQKPRSLLQYRALGEEIVTIFVGPNRKRFPIHKILLFTRSDFFSKAFNGGFEEVETGVMNLPEDDEDAFGAFCHVDLSWNFLCSLPLSIWHKDNILPKICKKC